MILSSKRSWFRSSDGTLTQMVRKAFEYRSATEVVDRSRSLKHSAISKVSEVFSKILAFFLV
jgi:hypothetical protein